MRGVWRRGWVRLVVVIGVVGVLILGAFMLYLLNLAGDLPGQVDPTRIPTTPFADIPGFTQPKILVATPAGS